MDEYKVTVAEAARRFGVQEQAIRKRIKRETLRSEKDEDGRVYVYISTDRTEEGYADRDELVEALRSQVEMLRAELADRKEEARRKDHLLAAALERIPEIEAPREPQNQAESAESRSDRGRVPEEPETAAERPWWRRMFGG